MQGAEFYPLQTFVELHDVLSEGLQIVVVAFEQLDRFHLPHLLHLDIVELIASLVLLAPDEALEDDDVELAVVG